MTYHYTFIGANGIEAPIDLDEPMTLEKMQEYVGGYIEFVAIANRPEYLLCVNEEGLVHDLPYNSTASEIAEARIYGDVVLARTEAFE